MQSYRELLKLEQHVEGGYFNLFYSATDEVTVTSDRYEENKKRKAGTSIYFMLEKDDFSAWHRLKSDEIWHYYDGGSPIDVHVIEPNGNYYVRSLGNPSMDQNATFQVAIKAGCWFAAEVREKNTFGLVGCTVSPGFEYDDFELADKDTLISSYPKLESIIGKFISGKKPLSETIPSQLTIRKSKLTAEDYKNILGLERHIEGGYFSLFYKSEDDVIVNSSKYSRDIDKTPNEITRKAGTSIYFMLENNDFSAWHRIKSDEIWHYYDGGSSVDIHVIEPNGNYYVRTLGNPSVDQNAMFQVAIKAGCWFAAEVREKNTFGLVGCTVSPGFEYDDFELADKNELTASYPELKNVISRFCKELSKPSYFTTKTLTSATIALVAGFGLYQLSQSETVMNCINTINTKLGLK